MKILLLSPPFVKGFARNGRCDYVTWSGTQWYPIWLGYCGGLLEKNNHKVKLIDAPAMRIGFKETLRAVKEFKPDLVTVYSSTRSQKSDIDFLKEIRSRFFGRIILAGPYVSGIEEELLKSNNSIDGVVRGEFEYPLLKMAGGSRESEIDNLIWRKGCEVFSNPMRGPLTGSELDSLPFVTDFYARHLDLRNYHVPSELFPFLDLFTGRGCAWGRCIFCLWPHAFIKGPAYATRSINNVMEELDFVARKLSSIRQVFFQDDTLPAHRATELSEAILKRRIKLTWGCYVRADTSYETLRLMKKAGCRTLHVGYESGVQALLDTINKGITLQQMHEFSKNSRKAGLRVHGDFLFGLPGETRDSLRTTINWAINLDPETAQFLKINLYGSTPVYGMLESASFHKKGVYERAAVTDKEIDDFIRQAYRKFYLRRGFMKRLCLYPFEYCFRQIPAVEQMIKRMLFGPDRPYSQAADQR